MTPVPGTMYQGRIELRCPQCGFTTWLARDNDKIICTKDNCKGELPCRRKSDQEIPKLMPELPWT